MASTEAVSQLTAELSSTSLSPERKILLAELKAVSKRLNRSEQKMRIISSYGAKFPLVGREPLCKFMFEEVAKRVLKSADKESHPILHLSTGPGMGKSAALAKIKQVLLAGKKLYRHQPSEETASSLCFDAACPIVFSYGAGSFVEPIEREEATVTQAFAKRLLYCHFMSAASCCFSDFLSATKHLKPTIKDALFAIAEDAKSKVLIVGVDEYNKFLEGVDPQSTKRRIQLLRVIVDELAAFQASYVHHGVFLVTVFAGTKKQELSTVFASSNVKSVLLPLPLLTFEQSYSLLLALKDTEGFDKLKIAMEHSNAKVVKCLHLLAGHPRSIEQWLKALCHEPGTYSLENSILGSFSQLKCMYSTFPADPIPLLAVCLFEIPLRLNDELAADITVATLSERGYCLLEEKQGACYVRLPCFWMWLHGGGMQTIGELIQTLAKLDVPGTQFEMVNFLYRASLMDLLQLVATEYSTTRWGRKLLKAAKKNILDLLYKGALVDPDVQVSLPTTVLEEFASPVSPYNLPFHFGQANKRFPDSSPALHLNRTSGKGIDLVAWLLPDVVVLEQHKHRDSENAQYKIDASTLKELEMKMRTAAESSDHFTSTPTYITAVVTNKLLTDVKSHQQGFPSIVVSGSSQSFGPFSQAINPSKIDMSLAGEKELQNLPLVGKVSAQAIVTKRPKNAQELVKEVLNPTYHEAQLQETVAEVEETLRDYAFFSAEILKNNFMLK